MGQYFLSFTVRHVPSRQGSVLARILHAKGTKIYKFLQILFFL